MPEGGQPQAVPQPVGTRFWSPEVRRPLLPPLSCAPLTASPASRRTHWQNDEWDVLSCTNSLPQLYALRSSRWDLPGARACLVPYPALCPAVCRALRCTLRGAPTSLVPCGVPCPPLQEDAVLLRHVLRQGRRLWGSLRSSGNLPHRDSRACCNRYRFLKRCGPAGPKGHVRHRAVGPG